MLTRWNQGWTEFDEMFSAMNQLKNFMDRVYDEGSVGRALEGRMLSGFGTGWPRANLVDHGSSLTVTAEVPGLTEKNVRLTLNQDVLTLEGERMNETPQGYSTHRQERPAVQFSRSFTLPCLINADRTTATVKNGLLTVTMEKASEAMPRHIAVKAS